MFATQSSSAVADYWTLFQYPKSIHRSRSLGSTNNRRQVPRDTPRRLVLASEIQVDPTRSRKLRSTSHVSHSQNKTNQSIDLTELKIQRLKARALVTMGRGPPSPSPCSGC